MSPFAHLYPIWCIDMLRISWLMNANANYDGLSFVNVYAIDAHNIHTHTQHKSRKVNVLAEVKLRSQTKIIDNNTKRTSERKRNEDRIRSKQATCILTMAREYTVTEGKHAHTTHTLPLSMIEIYRLRHRSPILPFNVHNFPNTFNFICYVLLLMLFSQSQRLLLLDGALT